VTSPAKLWSGASFERIAETFAPIHDRVVAALAPAPAERWLDLGCGTGPVALRAARAGATVVGLDISPEQLEKARAAATDAGLEVQFDEGDVEALPYPDGAFDVVASVFGAIFAADHRQASAEIGRIVRSRGRLGLTAWPHDDWVELGARVGRDQPEGDDSTDWGREGYVRECLGGAFDLVFESGEWLVEDEPEELWRLIRTSAPPFKAWFDALGDDRQAQVREAYLEFFASGRLRRVYLLALGRRR
jgi:SAM-dependent methyltransferase